jgi:urocanate hydratase
MDEMSESLRVGTQGIQGTLENPVSCGTCRFDGRLKGKRLLITLELLRGNRDSRGL